ncbi:HGxxPAAW family protein [Streptomyces sp. NPDC057877]|uniref:HGxxPAAW family protein n=1 Tax=Streptomyces sp. NPDC057877 TaxID=3346269 RepID=UPI003673C1F6
MSDFHGDHDMGHTLAGWTGTASCLAGCAVAGVSLCAARPAGVLLGAGVVAAGALVTWALHLAGWGKPSGPRAREEWDWRARDPMTGHADCPGCRLAGRKRRPLAVSPAPPTGSRPAIPASPPSHG